MSKADGEEWVDGLRCVHYKHLFGLAERVKFAKLEIFIMGLLEREGCGRKKAPKPGLVLRGFGLPNLDRLLVFHTAHSQVKALRINIGNTFETIRIRKDYDVRDFFGGYEQQEYNVDEVCMCAFKVDARRSTVRYEANLSARWNRMESQFFCGFYGRVRVGNGTMNRSGTRRRARCRSRRCR